MSVCNGRDNIVTRMASEISLGFVWFINQNQTINKEKNDGAFKLFMYRKVNSNRKEINSTIGKK